MKNATAQIDGHLVQQGRHAPRAEQLLGRTTGAAEGAGQAAALARLQQDHRRQNDADQDVNNYQQCVQHAHSLPQRSRMTNLDRPVRRRSDRQGTSKLTPVFHDVKPAEARSPIIALKRPSKRRFQAIPCRP